MTALAYLARSPAIYIKTPTATFADVLGAKLVGFVDFEDNTKITPGTGTVAAIADSISAAAYAQLTAAAQPALTTNARTGRQEARFDGTDDELEYLIGIPTGIPTGANPGEIIFIGSQNDLAISVVRHAVGYGGGAPSTQRLLRVGVAGNTTYVVNGTSAQFSGAFTGNCLIRAVADGTTVYCGRDGAMGSPVAVVPATGTSRLRIGAGAGTSASGFWMGGCSAVLFTNAVLTAAEFDGVATAAAPRLWG